MNALENAEEALACADRGEYIGSVALLALLSSLVKYCKEQK